MILIIYGLMIVYLGLKSLKITIQSFTLSGETKRIENEKKLNEVDELMSEGNEAGLSNKGFLRSTTFVALSVIMFYLIFYILSLIKLNDARFTLLITFFITYMFRNLFRMRSIIIERRIPKQTLLSVLFPILSVVYVSYFIVMQIMNF